MSPSPTDDESRPGRLYSMDRYADKKVKVWEQHGQTIMLFVITAVLGFASKTLWDANAVQATMVAEIRSLTSNVARLEGALSAMQQQYVSRNEFAIHEQRIQRVEGLAHQPEHLK
jgi:hypothetical protein